MKTFGENLKYFRALNKLSQKEFALKMQTTQQRVSEWECDRVEPSLYNIIKILKIFGITFEELVEGMNEK
ncbi:MAG: helix-turn-helix transcriptional regulator [Clostridiales bacterium]|nr:helix-turn-helix transcriptional regulator [Clostridiales bacterium]MBQ3020547.1 helix-turn-helix transcriptional regulator [Clostridia bacterium]